jgi:hypothetical protein
MRTPAGQAAAFETIGDKLEVTIPRDALVPDSSARLVAEAKIYIDTFLSYNVGDSRLFVLAQNDDKVMGLFDAMYVDGTHIKAMNGWGAQKMIVNSTQVAALQAQGKMLPKTWFSLKFVISGGKAQVFVNDEVVATSDVAPQFEKSDLPVKLQIGGFKGYVDEVRLSR